MSSQTHHCRGQAMTLPLLSGTFTCSLANKLKSYIICGRQQLVTPSTHGKMSQLPKVVKLVLECGVWAPVHQNILFRVDAAGRSSSSSVELLIVMFCFYLVLFGT